MKQHLKWFATALAVARGLVIASSAQAQTVIATLSDFQNFTLSTTYGSWNTGLLPIPGPPTIISDGPFEVIAQGWGGGSYDFTTPIDATGANAFQFTFTINNTMAHGDGSGLWFGPNLDISDGTHMVHLMGLPYFLNYGPYVGPGTYTLTGPLTDQFGGADLDPSDITSFNLEVDPAEYSPDAPYDITYNRLVMIAVPEPTALALLAIGITGLVIARHRV
jgi:hypothetical protein